MGREFIFSYPSFVMIGNYDLDADGRPILDDCTEFRTATLNGIEHLAVFTDEHSASEYREAVCKDFSCYGFANAHQLRAFLESLRKEVFPRIVFDLNHKTKRGQCFSMDEVLLGLAQTE